jgi:hypothetical protein
MKVLGFTKNIYVDCMEVHNLHHEIQLGSLGINDKAFTKYMTVLFGLANTAFATAAT